MIAAGVGVSAVMMGTIVALRGLMGLSSPFIGTIADRIGYKKIMQGGLFLTGLGMIVAGLSHSILLFSAAIVITGIGQAGYTPNLHAYLSTKLSYEKRARGIGIIEYSWALAGIVGLFAAGYLIDAFSWRAPFLLFGTLLIVAALFYNTLPASRLIKQNAAPERREKRSLSSRKKQIAVFLDLGPNAKSAWGAISVQGLNMFAIMHVMIIHGGWLSREYGLDPSSLGNIAFIFGIGDLTASIIVSTAVDRIGKKKSVTIGIAGMTLGYALMPFLNVELYTAVLALLLPRLFFEFATVSNLALLTEQIPTHRGKVMSLGTTVGLIGITVASALGPVSYFRWGVPGLAAISFTAGVVSFLIILFIVKDKLPQKHFI